MIVKELNLAVVTELCRNWGCRIEVYKASFLYNAPRTKGGANHGESGRRESGSKKDP
jgi:hypothetical protein